MTLHDVWRELIRAGCEEAAVGLLEDLVDRMIAAEEVRRYAGIDTMDEITASLLRPMIDDMADNERLNLFVDTYRCDREEFARICREHVWESIKAFDVRDD